jgi:phosphatidylglycerophosphate synthase
VRRVHVEPLAGLGAAVALLGGLAATTGLRAAALVIGLGCAVVGWALLESAMTEAGLSVLGPASRVTLVRATLATTLAALVVQSWLAGVPRPLFVGIALVALATDTIDGRIARRTGSVSAFGARFDMESDSFLILVLSGYVAPTAGWWVLAIGLARYALLVADRVWPWLRGATPPRAWAKVVAALQGITLAVAAADVLPLVWSRGLLAVALALLAESFGHQVWALRRQRHTYVATARTPSRIVDVCAVVVVWVALMLPTHPDRLSPRAFLGIPLELLAFAALALVLPPRVRRPVAVAGGLVLTVMVLLTTADLGFYEAFDRPVDPLSDPRYAGSGMGVLRDSVGTPVAVVVVVVAGLLLVGVVGVLVWAVLRTGRAVRSARRPSTAVLAGLALLWTVGAATGAQVDGGVPFAGAPGYRLVTAQVDQVRGDLRDRAMFRRELAHDPVAGTPGSRLLTGLRGKDVLLVFVESYGRTAVEGTWFAPQVDRTLGVVTRGLKGAGFAARSGWLTSPTFGGISWLAHSTMQTGLWIDSQERYDQVVQSNRFTLSDAFKRAGWRTVGDVPSNPSVWPEGSSFYHYDHLYNGSNVGYLGPRFSYAAMPDQYTFAAFDRNELQRSPRSPVMAEIDLVSSHTPWTPLPHLVPWRDLGDGSVFDGMQETHSSLASLFGGKTNTQADYARSVTYSLQSLLSFVRHAHDKKLVMVVLGDHQPATMVSGTGVSHDVPVSIVAHDPAVLRRIAGWGWSPGMQPSSTAPVATMDRFRNRFLTAYGPHHP